MLWSKASQLKPPEDNHHCCLYHRQSFSLCFALFITTVPISFLVGVLFFLVFSFQVQNPKDISSSLRLPSDDGDPNAYLVNFSATKLTTLVSWISSVATLLPGSLMTLFSYRIANKLRERSDAAEVDGLPTPYQFGLLLEGLDGKYISLWHAFLYLLWRKRAKIRSPVHLTFGTLITIFLLK